MPSTKYELLNQDDSHLREMADNQAHTSAIPDVMAHWPALNSSEAMYVHGRRLMVHGHLRASESSTHDRNA